MIKFMHTRIRVSDRAQLPLSSWASTAEKDSPQGNKLAFYRQATTTSGLDSPDFRLISQDLMHTRVGVLTSSNARGTLRPGHRDWPEDWRKSLQLGTQMAFVTDPDGYEVEILEN